MKKDSLTLTHRFALRKSKVSLQIIVCGSYQHFPFNGCAHRSLRAKGKMHQRRPERVIHLPLPAGLHGQPVSPLFSRVNFRQLRAKCGINCTHSKGRKGIFNHLGADFLSFRSRRCEIVDDEKKMDRSSDDAPASDAITQ